ncbi:MAG: hypothetical protein Q9227_000002 [Pyrenula ochraceoflavens]
MPVTVAIAGGTSAGLGRSIVTALHSNSSFTPVVLSRASSKTPKWLGSLNIEVRKVDYSSSDSLFPALQGVHILIVTLLASDNTWCSSQLNLLDAALRAGVKRFAPAEFGVGPKASASVDILKAQAPVVEACRKATAEHAGFEFARFSVGIFMNYLGYGAVDEEVALAGKGNDGEFVWNVKEMKAEIPLIEGKENERSVPRITMTELGDVGRFVAAACELPLGEWKEDMFCVGDTLRLDEVVEIVERMRGRKMEVKYRTVEEIRQDLGKAREKGDVLGVMWLQLQEMCTRDEEEASWLTPVVNQMCPQVKATTVEEYVKRFWSN